MDGHDLDTLMDGLREKEAKVGPVLAREFARRLEISSIYHDSALEGVVLSYSEIKAAIDKNIISDVSLIPSYQEIKQLKEAMDWAKDYAVGSGLRAVSASASASQAAQAARRKPLNLEVIRKIYAILAPDEASKGLPYRKENPLHRLYYHEIAQPPQIQLRMKKLGEWLDEDATKRMHAVERAARLHFRLMSIYPWTKHSGRIARVLSNLVLLRDGYPPAVVHSIDRQRYYESLRAEHMGIVPLYHEAVATSIESALKFYDEATATVARRRAAG